ncbi:MAG: DsbA family oxidoreductase [Roseivirga sp.]|uniref:DsbA family oxidoreductase n=1 Tax=Roseivirga sp. TaxID=1964215 RepID=UPI001B062BF5|nr:DsbA family oxidoreductase [Roseivirga sp.]MBO6659563.1 DsbA family oxidoreductase [Roseivirga sp.]MBO6759525.1 DsbA family oxidoreductase [Roseivirga sp.]MBO6907700.1 DsbA family oxidoreductase [Roseivirga sp.]
MKIEIWSDVMCPFCYIGKRHLEEALADFPQKDEVEIVWKSFQLNPDMPESSEENVYEYLAEAKGISLEQSKQMHERVEEMAATAGLDYNFDIAKVANSFKAHRVLQLAKRKNLGNELKEALLEAYFIKGKNTSDYNTLVELATSVGITEAEVELALNEEQFANYVKQDIDEARQIRVQGVPFFVFDRKYAVSGAQPVEHFKATLEKLQAESSSFINTSPEQGDSCDVDGNC